MPWIDRFKLLLLGLTLTMGAATLPGCVVDGDDDDAEVEVRDTGDGVKMEVDD